jgi:hypothetical protein
MEQLQPEIRSAIFGNVGTIITFRVGAIDAEYLAKEFYSTFDMQDLVNLPKFCMYLKLMIDGTTSQPFSARSLPLRENGKSFKNEVIDASRKHYGRNKKEVEQELLKRYNPEPRDQQTLFS